MTPERLDAYLVNMLDLIDTYGIAVQGVFDPNGEDHPFCYTVGRTARDLPELVMVGLPMEAAQSWLNIFDKQPIAAGEHYPAAINGAYDVWAVQMDLGWVLDNVTIAKRLYPLSDLHAIQLVFADKDNRPPWDPESPMAIPVYGQAPNEFTTVQLDLN